jgi:hypothetical protein
MQHPVQACITNVSFPKDLEALYGMLEKNRSIAGDLDFFLNFTPGDTLYWTAPKWLTEGDILFFYHAATATQRISRLRRKAKALALGELVAFLEHSHALADRYSGTIFGYAIVAGQSEFFDDDNSDLHFKGKVFAPLKRTHVFKNPLSAKVFAQTLKISRQSALTYLTRPQFDNIKQQLSIQNTLPDYLTDAEFAEQSLRNVTRDNWISVACADHTRFALEIQLRDYFLVHFLEAIKDAKTPLLEECQCRRNGKNTGFADYFIKLHGKWIPVEAKLNVKAEERLFEQLAKYIHIDSFVPTKGNRKDECFTTVDNDFCIVVDQFGIYFVLEDKYAECDEDSPLWARTDIDQAMIGGVRKKLKKYLTQGLD